MATALADGQITVNNDIIAFVPNSLVYKEGKGEQNVRVATSGGGATQIVFSNNIETNKGMVQFSMFPTIGDQSSLEKVRTWQDSGDGNVITITGRTKDDDTFTRTFKSAVVINDPEINLSFDGQVEVQFESQQSV